VLIDEEYVMLETGVQMRFKTKLPDDWVVMTVDVGVYAIHSLEDLSNHAGERFGKWHTYTLLVNHV
jgi:hypothetical protein